MPEATENASATFSAPRIVEAKARARESAARLFANATKYAALKDGSFLASLLHSSIMAGLLRTHRQWLSVEIVRRPQLEVSAGIVVAGRTLIQLAVSPDHNGHNQNYHADRGTRQGEEPL